MPRRTLMLLSTLALAAPLGAQPQPAPPEAPAAAPAPTTPELDYDADLLGFWGYDFAHLARRDDIAELSQTSRLRHILQYLGRTVWLFEPSGVLYIRNATPLEIEMDYEIEADTLVTNADRAVEATPARLRKVADHALVASFDDAGEHDSFRLVRLAWPGSEIIGSWIGAEGHEGVRLEITRAGAVRLFGWERPVRGKADLASAGPEHALTPADGGEMSLVVADDFAAATLRLDDESIELRRSFDPMAWIEGRWDLDPVATHRHEFYAIWPEAFGIDPPMLEPRIALMVLNGLHTGRYPLSVAGIAGDVVVFRVGEGDDRALLPVRRLSDDAFETLFEKQVMRRFRPDQPPAGAEENDDRTR